MEDVDVEAGVYGALQIKKERKTMMSSAKVKGIIERRLGFRSVPYSAAYTHSKK